jgi:hypothetical protein
MVSSRSIDRSEEARERDEFFFWPKVNKESGVYPIPGGEQCWEWTATRDMLGYGRFGSAIFGGRTVAHRISFFLRYDMASTAKRHLDHLCRNPGCVNPQHLELVSAQTNILRGVSPSAINAAKTHCIHGHEFTPENTMLNRHNRTCRECHRRVCREWYTRKHGTQ